MPLLAIGLNHKTAPVDIREQVAISPDQIPDVLRSLTSQAEVSEAAILSTCNRMEMLCYVEDTENNQLLDWLCQYHELSKEQLAPYIYTHPDQSAVRHLLRVASGLDSMVLGEPQILGQIKDAYVTAKKAGTIGRMLGGLFEHTFSAAKDIRTNTAIGANPVSVAYAAVSLARQIFSNLEDHTALLIGAGETIELTARHLKEKGIGRIIIANRTLSRAENLINELKGEAITLQEIPDFLPQADIVISSTASPLPILGKGAVERAIKIRKHQPILMVDIAVPRDIEPEVSTLNDIYLYTVDDLQEIIDENMKSRQEAANQAEEIIDSQVRHFMGWVRSLDSVSTICHYRKQAENICDNEIQKAQRLLNNGHDTDEVLQHMARALTKKLIHAPSQNMRRASFEGREELLKAARELLNIKDSDN